MDILSGTDFDTDLIDEIREHFEEIDFSNVYNKLVHLPKLPIPSQKPLCNLKLVDAENKIFHEYTRSYDNTPAKNMSVNAILNYDIDEIKLPSFEELSATTQYTILEAIDTSHFCHGAYSRFFRPNMKSDTHTIRFSVSKLVDGIFDIYIYSSEPIRGYITYSDCVYMSHGERRILAVASLLHKSGKYIYTFLREDGTELFDINNILLAGHTEGRPNFYIHIIDEDKSIENCVEVVYKGVTFIGSVHSLFNDRLSYTIDLSNDKYLVVYKNKNGTIIFKYDDAANEAELFNILSRPEIDNLKKTFELENIRECL